MTNANDRHPESKMYGMTARTSQIMFHPVFGRVDIVRVFKDTATVRYWGAGLSEGKRLTRRGVPLSRLFPLRVRSDESN